ncbi:MAG: ATP synthase F1 subunit epsilon [Bradymonadales bacterium]|nr:ATP synthase F1 subunit epsilon [Bradymonadales bacterium]
MSAGKLILEIVTPTREVLRREVDAVTLTGALGELQALPGHRALLTSLRPGRLVWEMGFLIESYQVEGGFAEVLPDRVTVLADECTLVQPVGPREVDKR